MNVVEKGVWEFIMHGPDGTDYRNKNIFTEIIWRYPKYSGTSVVTFELTAEGDATKLKLTHQGIDSFPKDDPSFAKESFSRGWNYIINTSLKEFIEK